MYWIPDLLIIMTYKLAQIAIKDVQYIIISQCTTNQSTPQTQKTASKGTDSTKKYTPNRSKKDKLLNSKEQKRNAKMDISYTRQNKKSLKRANNRNNHWLSILAKICPLTMLKQSTKNPLSSNGISIRVVLQLTSKVECLIRWANFLFSVKKMRFSKLSWWINLFW